MNSDNLGTLAIGCAVATTVLQLLDWLLPPAAVQKLRDLLERLWLWLAEQRAGRLFRRLLEPPTLARLAIILAAVIATSTLAFFVLVRAGTPRPQQIVEILLNLLAFCALGSSLSLAAFALSGFTWARRVALWVTLTKRPLAVLGRLTVVVALAALPLLVPGLLNQALGLRGSATGAYFGYFLVGVFIGMPALLLALAFLSLSWLLLLSVLAPLLRVAEFLVLRLAEHPKGPVLGLSALLAAIGALMKVFS